MLVLRSGGGRDTERGVERRPGKEPGFICIEVTGTEEDQTRLCPQAPFCVTSTAPLMCMWWHSRRFVLGRAASDRKRALATACLSFRVASSTPPYGKSAALVPQQTLKTHLQAIGAT